MFQNLLGLTSQDSRYCRQILQILVLSCSYEKFFQEVWGKFLFHICEILIASFVKLK